MRPTLPPSVEPSGEVKKKHASLPDAPRQAGDFSNNLSLAVGPALVGLFLGWQAALVLGGTCVFLHWVVIWLCTSHWPGLRRASPGIWLVLATLCWIPAWNSALQWW